LVHLMILCQLHRLCSINQMAGWMNMNDKLGWIEDKVIIRHYHRICLEEVRRNHKKTSVRIVDFWTKIQNHYTMAFSPIKIKITCHFQISLQFDFSTYPSNLLLVSLRHLFDVYGLFLESLTLAAWYSNCDSLPWCPQP